MPRMFARASRLLLLLSVPALALAACSNSSGGNTTAGETDGITANQITVGGIAAATGPLADQYSPLFQTVQSYFDQVNAKGGVFGRKLVLPASNQLDDQTVP